MALVASCFPQTYASQVARMEMKLKKESGTSRMITAGQTLARPSWLWAQGRNPPEYQRGPARLEAEGMVIVFLLHESTQVKHGVHIVYSVLR